MITVTWWKPDEPPSKIPVAYPGFHFCGHKFNSLTQIIYIYPVGNLSHLLSCPFVVHGMAIFRGRALGCAPERYGVMSITVASDKPRLHDTTCCQTGCQTGLTTGCIVYTAGCHTSCTTRFDNRLNEQWLFVQHGVNPV